MYFGVSSLTGLFLRKPLHFSLADAKGPSSRHSESVNLEVSFLWLAVLIGWNSFFSSTLEEENNFLLST